MGTLSRRRQVGMANDRSLIEWRGIVDTLAALLDFFFLISDTCLNLILLTATATSRHIAMTHACIALHFVDVRTLGETPSQPHFVSFHLWCLTDFTLPPHTIPLTLWVSMTGALMLQPWDTMSLIKADLSSVRGRARAHLGSLKHPNRATLYLLYTSLCTEELNVIRKHKCFLSSPFYGRACRWAMLGELKPKGPKGV